MGLKMDQCVIRVCPCHCALSYLNFYVMDGNTTPRYVPSHPSTYITTVLHQSDSFIYMCLWCPVCLCLLTNVSPAMCFTCHMCLMCHRHEPVAATPWNRQHVIQRWPPAWARLLLEVVNINIPPPRTGPIGFKILNMTAHS